jgi:Icc-related predicted phosphoesterase
MRLQLLSDLHFEFHADHGDSFVASMDPSGVDVLVVAGDLADSSGIERALSLFCDRYRDATVVFVHGNHELYGSDRDAVYALTERSVRAHDNLVWLEMRTAEIAGRRFVGTTLWFEPPPNLDRFRRYLEDYRAIADLESWVADANRAAVAFLEDEVREGDIVVTHHLPSYKCVAPRYSGNALNPFFVCDVEDLLVERGPSLWLHGHTHESIRKTIGRTTVVCNPFGYVGHELNPAFQDALVLDI